MSKGKSIVYLGPVEGFEEVQKVIGVKHFLSHARATSEDLLEKLQTSHALIDASMRVTFSIFI